MFSSQFYVELVEWYIQKVTCGECYGAKCREKDDFFQFFEISGLRRASQRHLSA